MNNIVQRAIDDFDLIASGDNIIVALSGGADSVSLLHVLYSIKEKYNLNIYACHINHMIRGAEADADEQFVTKMCSDMGVKLFVKRADVPLIAKQQKISLELCGRNVRYDFFDELAHTLDAKVATAHTSSDNVETVLYNLSRGASAGGMCGIKPKRDYIIRPLIYAARKDVERYCVENNLSYVTDSTNASDDYTRNKIRHNIVPVLRSLNPDVEGAVNRMCNSMTDIVLFLDDYSKKELNKCKTDNGYSAKKLLELDNAVLTNVLCIIAKDCGVTLNSTHIGLIKSALKSGGCVDLPRDLRAVCKQGTLRFVRSTGSCDTVVEIPIENYDKLERFSADDIAKINKNFLFELIDCDIISSDTVIRTRKAGDTFTLCNRNVTKSLKKLFNELKIPAEKRDSLLVAANGSTVLWIEGIGVSAQGRVTADTKHAVKIIV